MHDDGRNRGPRSRHCVIKTIQLLDSHSSMERRTLLAAIAPIAGLAVSGCLGSFRDEPVHENAPSELVSVRGRALESDEIEIGGEPTSAFTEESTGRVDLSVTNLTDETKTVSALAALPIPPNAGEHTNSNDQLVLLPSDRTGYEHPDTDPEDSVLPQSPTDGCWKPRPELGGPVLQPYGASIDSNESLTREYKAFADEDNDSCLEPGVYTFESEVNVSGVDGEIDVELEIELE